VKGFLLFLILLGGGVAWSYTQYLSPEARHRRSAVEFLHQTHLDDLARAGVMSAYRDERENDKITASEFDCMESAIARGFDTHLANMLTRRISRYDIERATDFYSTPAGDKFARMLVWAVASRVPSLGLENEGEEPTLFMEDIVELDTYRKSLKAREQAEPLQTAFDLIVEPEMVEFEREKRRECLPAAKA
jgi:hypothetical protein